MHANAIACAAGNWRTENQVARKPENFHPSGFIGKIIPTAWASAAALAVQVAFPPLDWTGLAWVGLLPVFLGITWGGGGIREWFLGGWIFGLIFFGIQFVWLHRTLAQLGGMAPLRFAMTYLLLIGFLSLLPGISFAAARWGWRHAGLSPLLTLPAMLAGQDALLGVFPFSGLGWGSLAATQPATTAAGMLVPRMGGPGVVLLLALVNAAWAWMTRQWIVNRSPAERPSRGKLALPSLPFPAFPIAVVLLALVTIYFAWPAGKRKLGENLPSFPALLVPGGLSIPQLDSQRGTPATLRYYLGRTLSGAGEEPRSQRPGLVIWPESASGSPLERGGALAELAGVAEMLRMDILLGSNRVEQGRDRNSLYLALGASGEGSGFPRYDKRMLVPFGEYVPSGFRWLFPRKITAGSSDYVPGTAPPVLDWRGVQLGLAICFESILPAHFRGAVVEGAGVLVVVANDAWITDAAARQHLQLTALRGLETGRDVLFVSNGGAAAHLRGGRVLAAADADSPPLLVHAKIRTGYTPWVRWGYLPLGLSMALLFGAALLIRILAPKG
jgi:apolipoprotein N-acyltransferase